MSLSPSRLFVATAAALLALPAPAGAADRFGGEPLNLQAGGLVIVAPKYEGSKEYDVMGVPLLAPAGSSELGFIQFRGPDDIRLRVFNQGGLEIGPLVGWRFDRDENDSDRLDGLGDVDGGLVVGGFAAYRFGLFTPFVSYGHQVTGDDTGGLLRFGADVPISQSAFKLTGQIGATWADDDYMDAYFSVAAPTALLAAYDADAGIKDVYVGLNADVPLNDRWNLKLMGKYSRLVGDAADSPVVESEDQFFGGVGLTYRFAIDR